MKSNIKILALNPTHYSTATEESKALTGANVSLLMRRYIFLSSSSRHVRLRNYERFLYVTLWEKKEESSNKHHCVLFIAVFPPRYFSGYRRQVDLRIRFLSPPRNSGICFHWDLVSFALLLFLPRHYKIYLPPICFIAHDVLFLYPLHLKYKYKDKYCHSRQKKWCLVRWCVFSVVEMHL